MSLISSVDWQKSIWMTIRERRVIVMLRFSGTFCVGAYQIRGLARIRQNKFDEAIEDYKTAIKYDPENVVLWHNLSLCHIQKEDYEAAKEDFGYASDNCPPDIHVPI